MNNELQPEKTKADVVRQVGVLIVVIGSTIAANVLNFVTAVTDTGNIANDLFASNVFFFPASYVFGTIWPLIYLGIIGLAIHQVLPSQATNPRYRAGGYWLAANLVLNAAWVAVFGLRLFTLSFVTILPILITGILAYARLGVARTPQAPTAERVLKTSVGIYTAWLTIATIANASLALAAAEWGGFGVSYETWGVIIAAVGIVVGLALLALFKDASFPAVYAYAYIGIFVRQVGSVQPVAITAAIGGGVFLILFVIVLIRSTGKKLKA